MDMEIFDFALCDLSEKQVIEGLCLSYDILRGCCLETMAECFAGPKTSEKAAEMRESQIF